jgi:sterol 14-demethylase
LLLPKKHSAPPTVFHLFPIIGSAVTYGIDPYKFFFDNREKVSDYVFRAGQVGKLITCTASSFS